MTTECPPQIKLSRSPQQLESAIFRYLVDQANAGDRRAYDLMIAVGHRRHLDAGGKDIHPPGQFPPDHAWT